MNLDEIAADGKKSTGDLKNINLLATRMLKLEGEIQEAEGVLKQKKADLYKLETQELPDEMDACGLKEFVLTNGQKIAVEQVLSASLPSQGQIKKADDEMKPILEDRLATGLKFLRENGAESLIKNILELDLDKGKDNLVAEIIKIAEEHDIPTNREETVHAQTLNKYLKERIREGKPVPMDTFAVYSGRCAYIVKPKTKKEKI